MTWYVAIDRLSRGGFVELAEELADLGFGDRVEYNSGGWADKELGIAWPHLKFEMRDDAVAYILKFGGVVKTEIPGKHNS